MPTYEYRCKACSQELEVVQSFTDDALTTCEACGGQLRKLFGNVGIAFKGSGFYKNDSRGKSTNGAATADKAGTDKSGSDKSGSDSGSSTTKDSGSSTKKDTAAASSGSSAKTDTAKTSSKTA